MLRFGFICALAGLICCAAAVQAVAADTSRLLSEGFADTLTGTVFSSRLRAADALLTIENGDVYVLDTQQGQISVLSDRGKDGRADGIRRLPQTFDRPTAFALQDGRIFVADARGIWGLRMDGSKDLMASLERAKAEGPVHLIAGDKAGRLIIGLTTDGVAKLITLDIATGIALPRAETPGTLLALRRLAGGTLWTSVETAPGQTRFSPELTPHMAPLRTRLTDFILLSEGEMWTGKLIGVLDDTRVAALPMDFGTPRLPGQSLVETFNPRARLKTSGDVGAIGADARGLFVFNRHTRTLWCVRPKRSVPSDPATLPVSPDDTAPDP